LAISQENKVAPKANDLDEEEYIKKMDIVEMPGVSNRTQNRPGRQVRCYPMDSPNIRNGI